MKLVFIYGPPAVGKLSVATHLARITGFKLYHNHVSIEHVRSIFEFGSPAFQRLVDKYRREMLEEAAKERIDTIFTFVYGKEYDDEFVRDIVGRVESNAGRVLFVRLYCERKELVRRITLKGRRERGKLGTRKGLLALLETIDVESEVPIGKTFSIDTTNNPPVKTARMIAQHYKL